MKLSRIILLLALATMAARADVKIGDTYQQVIDQLGDPQGEIKSGTYQLLSFDRGRVELRNGKVAKTEILSDEQVEKKRLLAEKKLAEAERKFAAEREQRIAEGTTVHAAKLADEEFMVSPAADRVAFWQNFKKLYPEVPLGDEYTAALRELEQDYAARRIERERQQQISDLEQRVADAEARADRAEQHQSPVVVYDTPSIYGGYPAYGFYPWRSVSQRTPSDQPHNPFNNRPPSASSTAQHSPFRSDYAAPPLSTPFNSGFNSFNGGFNSVNSFNGGFNSINSFNGGFTAGATTR